ncbi:MAG: hypothetical protein ACJZ9L_03915 [Coraliomargaritaceae bacterium]
MKICFAIPIFVILSLKICELSAAIVDEQFDVYPSYLGFEYENDSSDSILSEQFNVLPSYFTYDSDGDISTSIYNGKINLLTNGLPPSYENDLFISYSINQEDANGILYFTVEAGNSVTVTDGGTWINEDGDVDPMNLAEVGISFDNFGGDGLITLENANGTKRIRYSNSLFGDGYLNVDNFDKVYLRLSYDFDTSYYKTYYSIDGINFTELSEIYGPQASTFNVALEAESRNVSFNQGEAYFDNFVISKSPYYNLSEVTNLEANTTNGVMNIIGGNGSGLKLIELSYPVNSSMTNSDNLYFTVLASSYVNLIDGGTFVDDEGDIQPFYEIECSLNFNDFNGDSDIALVNKNGVKSIKYGDASIPNEDGYLNVDSLENIYLRSSYNFNTSIATTSYSTDGINFIELSNLYAPNDNFKVSLSTELRNIILEEGDVYFDNFVISEDMNYDSTLTDDPYSDSDGIVDSDGDGVADSEDPFPNEPLELELLGPTDFQPKDNVGWIEVSYAYMNGETFMPGIWHPIDSNLGAWFPFDGSWPSYTEGWPNAWPYYWSSEQQTSTNSVGDVGNWSHYKTSNPNVYTCKFNWTNGTYGFGFSYDGRIDLDNDGNQDGIQIRSGLTFPAEGSLIDFHQIINSLSENLALFTLPSSFTENDFDGDGRNNDIDIDDDNDGIADSYDQLPQVYDISNNAPTSFLGYVEIYFSDYAPAPSYGIWLPTSETNAINIWNYGGAESKWEGNYSVNSFLVSTDDQYGGSFRINLKDKTNDLFYKFNYVWQSDDGTPDDSGKGFFYDGRIDLDINGMADGQQIADGQAFPATESAIDLANIYDSAESNLIPIQVLDYASNKKYFPSELKDLRPSSTMIGVSENQATVQLQMEESSDLQTWEDTGTPATMIIPADTDTKFFRFKMAE